MRNRLLLLVLASAVQTPGAAQTPLRVYSLETVAGTLQTGDGGLATSAIIGSIQGVAVDRSGNLYISDTDNHRVRKIDLSGVITLLAGTGTAGFSGDGGPATKASLNLPYGLAVDADGNIYVADLGNNRVRRVAPDGTIVTVAGSGQSGSAADSAGATGTELLEPRNVAVDAAGNLYISEFAGHRVRKVTRSGQIATVAGTGTAGFNGDGGPANAAQLAYPAGLAIDGHGTLYVADSQNQRIRQVLSSGAISTLLGGTPATALFTPTAIAADASGAIYVADYSNIVRAYTPGGAWINFAGTGGLGFAGDGGPAVSATLAAAHDLAVDTRGRLYLADGARIRRVGADGIIQTIAGDQNLYAIGDGGDATAAPLYRPSAVALDNSGNLYVAETGAQRIRRVSASGQITTLAGTGVAGTAGDGGPAISAQLNSPAAVTVDAFGNVIVADANNHRVRQIATGGQISTVVAMDTAPQGVCADHMGNLYVMDTANHRVLRVAPGAVAVVVAGDGAACAVDTAGNLFIADTLNNRIRRVTPSGAISTVAGTGAAGFAGDGQPATSALLSGPAGVAVTDDGDIFIADTGNNRMRLVTSDGVIQTIAGGGTPLNAPGGLALDGSGNIYFAETGSNLVRRLTPGVAQAAAPITQLPITLVNSISLLAGPVAPGEVVTIFGSGLGPDPGVAGAFDAAGLLATIAGGTEVRFDGMAAPVFYAQAGQVNVQVPYAVGPAAATNVEVVVNGHTAGSLTLPVSVAAPALFPVVANQDGTPNSEAEPALPNTIVTLFGTGEGLTDGPNLSGQTAVAPYAHLKLPVTLTVAGMPAQILYAGSAPGLVGMLQINARLPGGFGLQGQAAVELTVGTALSPLISIWLK